MGITRKSWIQAPEAAIYLGVGTSVVRDWISAGALRAVKLPTGHLRILARDVVKMLLKEGKPIPDELGDLASKRVVIVDADKDAAHSLAKTLRETSGCKVAVAESAADARALLDAARPDIVVFGVRQPVSRGNGLASMVILAGVSYEAPKNGSSQPEVAFRVTDILPIPLDEGFLLSRMANLLLA